MATQVFLHDTAALTHRGQNTANLNGVAFIWLPKATGTVRGAGVVSKATNTSAGPITGVEVTDGAGGTRLEWLTPPVDQDVTISGTITGNIWALESSNSANTAINFVVDKVAATTMALTRIATSARTTELSTSNAAVNFTVTPTSTALNKGDRLRLRIFGDDAGTMGTGFTFTTAYAGTTAAASGDTYISFTETFGFQGGGALVTQDTGSDSFGNTSVQGGSGTREAVAQSFTLASDATVTGALVYVDDNSTTTDNLTMDLVSTLGGSSLGSGTIAGTAVAFGSNTAFNVTFGSPVSLTAGTYYLQFTRSGARDTTNYLYVKSSGTSSLYAGGTAWSRNSGSWTDAFGAGQDLRFTVLGSTPGSTIYLTDTASDVATADVDREAWTSRGAGVQNDVTNTQAGFFTPPAQVTDTAGGTAVSWFTKPLTAFTLSGLVTVNRRALESSAAANASIGAEIARVDNDGTNAVVWGYANRDAATTSGLAGEIALTETAYTCQVSGDDLAVSDGQRLRIRLFNDDCANGAQASGFTITSYYGGTSAGASGDTYLVLPQTVTEFSAGTTVSVTPGALTVTGQTVLLRQSQAVGAGALTITGQTVNTAVATVVGVTPGSLTLTGQTVNLALATVVGVTPGALTLTGQTVNTLLATVVGVTPGALTLTGQTVNVVIATVVGVTPGALTVTGQTVLLRSSQAVGTGALTLTGQTVNVGTSNTATPGALTITGQTVNTALALGITPGAVTISGQSVLLRTNMVVTPGALTLNGQTVNTLIAVVVGVTPGALTVTGQTVNTVLVTTVAVTPGAITLAGQTVNIGAASTVTVTPGALTVTGQTVGIGGVSTVTVTPGALTITGQSVLLRTNLVVSPGALTVSGQTVNTLLATVVPVTPGALTVSGSSLALIQSQAVSGGALVISGQNVNTGGVVVVTVTPGALTLTGQAVLQRTNLVVQPGALTITGQTVNTGAVATVTVTPGALTVTGQTVLLRNTVLVAPGALSLTGQAVGTIRTIPVTPGALTLAGQQVGLRTLATLQPGTITIRGSDVHLGIPEEYTIALQAIWQPALVLGGRHAPTVANRGAHRPTLVRAGVHLPTLTKAGTNSP